MSTSNVEISWSDCVVLFNSLISSIEKLRELVDSEDIDDDDLYEAEEELNDYVTLLARLREKYNNLQDKGDLPKNLVNKMNALV